MLIAHEIVLLSSIDEKFLFLDLLFKYLYLNLYGEYYFPREKLRTLELFSGCYSGMLMVDKGRAAKSGGCFGNGTGSSTIAGDTKAARFRVLAVASF